MLFLFFLAIEPTQMIQKICLTFIYGITCRHNISYMLRKAYWFSIQTPRFLQFTTFCHAFIPTGIPPYLAVRIRFRTDIYNINIRDKDTINFPRHKTTLHKCSLSSHILPCCNNSILSNLNNLIKV